MWKEHVLFVGNDSLNDNKQKSWIAALEKCIQVQGLMQLTLSFNFPHIYVQIILFDDLIFLG